MPPNREAVSGDRFHQGHGDWTKKCSLCARVRYLGPIRMVMWKAPIRDIMIWGIFSCPGLEKGFGSPVIKVSDHGRHVMSSSPASLKTRRVGQRCPLNLSRAETSSGWCGVVVRRGGC
ncbi:uncharacterized protein TNCV_3044251 [Trichonephila clavipes]|nr:uncharacterized protein TNCV_3044251 [Trichonephila clavipes]